MDAFANKRVEVDRQCRGQRFALARAHFCDFPLMESHRADDLNVKVTHLHDALTCLPHGRINVGNQTIQGCTGCQLRFEGRRLGF